MAKKPTVTTITSGFASVTTLNANYEALRDAFDNTISRDGSTPNTMTADFDMNSNDILNVNTITDSTGTDVVARAKTSADAAELALDQFTDLYLGAKASEPSTDNDGDALQTGAIYFNTTSNTFQVYNGSSFIVAVDSVPSPIAVANGGTGATTAAQAKVNLEITDGITLQQASDEALALAIALG